MTGSASDPLDYLGPLAACWFRREDVGRFEPVDRFITGNDLVARWSEVTDLDVDAFIRAKILESRLQDLHPITGGTRAALPSDTALPPLESGLFALSEIEAIEREDLALQELGLPLFERHTDARTTEFARRHHAVIARFGRFPHRNQALGRPSTSEEAAFLQQPGSRF